MIEVTNLKKTYTQGEQKLEILKGLSFKVEQGQSVAIVGKSGSGKSTFLSLLSGLDNANEGQLKISNTDLSLLNEDQLTNFRSKNIGIIFQQFHLIDHLTALENVKLALDIAGRDNSLETAKIALSEVGLLDRADHFPSQLSGGEKQRVAMARAICIKPNLLLADEPSGSLDEETSNRVMTVLFDLVRRHNLTLILVTHDSELAKNCEMMYRLEEGTLKKIEK